MSFFKRLFPSNTKIMAPPFASDPAPARLLYVVGDIHGRDDLLAQMLTIIDIDADGQAHDLVFVGDYVDRGEASQAVLERLQKLSKLDHITCLMGNHERMVLDFLDNPTRNGRRWLRNGGLQTLASFGVCSITETASPQALSKARDRFLRKLAPLETWLRDLQLSFQSGNIFTTHAAVKPDISVGDQSDTTLLWGHRSFFQATRQDGIWVVHGHYIVEEAKQYDGRISIDTGAYATGRLTAARIDRNKISFLTA